MSHYIKPLWENGGLFSIIFGILFLLKSCFRYVVWKEETEEFWYRGIEIFVYGCTASWGLNLILQSHIFDGGTWESKAGGLLGGSFLFLAALFGAWKIFFATKWFFPTLNIVSCTYGEKDVTFLLKELISKGKKNIYVGNNMFGFLFDPLPDSPKLLKITYVKGGADFDKEFKEGDLFQLDVKSKPGKFRQFIDKLFRK